MKNNLVTQNYPLLPFQGVLPSPEKTGVFHLGFPGRSILCQPLIQYSIFMNLKPKCYMTLLALKTSKSNMQNILAEINRLHV